MATIKVKPGVPQTLDAGDNPSFGEWMKRIDGYLIRNIGVSTGDLEDCPYMDWYEDRVRPIRAANKALKRAGADLY